MTIDELIDALEKAEGPSEALSYAVYSCLRVGPYNADIGYQHYTASLDAAVALVERVFPDDLFWSVNGNRLVGGNSYATIGALAIDVSGEHPQQAIALCIALLRAVNERDAGKEYKP